MPGKLYVHEDIMGSARRFTDGKGVTFGEIEYDIWGLPCVKAGAGNAGEGYEDILNPRYTNHTYDDVLGMYHAQFRFFDAGSRGFVQEDPIKDDLNWYGYCGGNPISNIDPIGCAAITVPPEISNYLNAISVDPITFGLGIAFGVVAFPFYYAYVNDINVAPPLADLEMYLDAFNDFPSKAEDWKSLRKIISKALEVSLPDKPVDYNADENHIRNGSKGHNHNWNKFNLDPNDPNSYPFILGIIKKTVENYDNISREIHNGRDTVFYFTKYFCDYDATVTVKLIELMESLRLSNAYVN